MKFSTIFSCFALALPASVIGAALPSASTNATLSSAETRGLGDVAQTLDARQAANVGRDVAKVIQGIVEQVERDNLGRGDFTQRTVAEGRKQWPQYNWVICHTAHRQFFDGAQGEQWGHYHREYDIQIGGTIGYEIYWFESGRFERHGDGGFLNWAYIGNVIRTENNGATVIFA